jgi:hypothetical protein
VVERVELFLRASVTGPIVRAVALLHEHPEIAGYDFRTAIVLGDVTQVRHFLATDPELALRPATAAGRRCWACAVLGGTATHAGSTGCWRSRNLLLDAGADPTPDPIFSDASACVIPVSPPPYDPMPRPMRHRHVAWSHPPPWPRRPETVGKSTPVVKSSVAE